MQSGPALTEESWNPKILTKPVVRAWAALQGINIQVHYPASKQAELRISAEHILSKRSSHWIICSDSLSPVFNLKVKNFWSLYQYAKRK